MRSSKIWEVHVSLHARESHENDARNSRAKIMRSPWVAMPARDTSSKHLCTSASETRLYEAQHWPIRESDATRDTGTRVWERDAKWRRSRAVRYTTRTLHTMSFSRWVSLFHFFLHQNLPKFFLHHPAIEGPIFEKVLCAGSRWWRKGFVENNGNTILAVTENRIFIYTEKPYY